MRASRGRSSAGGPDASRSRREDGARSEASEERQAELHKLKSRLNDLQESILLADVKDDLDNIRTTLALLPGQLEDLRLRGYVFKNYLERKVDVLREQWESVSRQAETEVRRQSRALEREANETEAALHKALRGGSVALSQAQAAVETLEHKVDGAETSVKAMFDTLRQNVDQTESQLREIEWLLEQVEQATFELFPAEDPVAASKAQLLETKKDGPKGVLYLTDERLIFEQKEKKVTKKVLFIATEKELVQDTILAVPVGLIETVQTSQDGFLGRKEILELLLAPEADLDRAVLRLRGATNEEWAGLIGRVQSGDIADERSQPKDEEAVEAVRSAPTTCPTCGAALDAEIVRGQREITCDYCGTLIRI